MAKSGHLALQAHGNEVSFKNLKVHVLKHRLAIETFAQMAHLNGHAAPIGLVGFAAVHRLSKYIKNRVTT